MNRGLLSGFVCSTDISSVLHSGKNTGNMLIKAFGSSVVGLYIILQSFSHFYGFEKILRT